MIKENDFAIFEYENEDGNIIGDLSDFLNRKGKKIFDFFEIKEPKKVLIKIIPSKREYDEIFRMDHKQEPHDYSVGHLHRCRQEIKMTSYNDYKNIPKKKDLSFDYYKKTVLHEFIHFVNLLFCKEHHCESYTTRYLSEGLACYLSGQFEGEDIKLNATLEEILTSNVKYTNYFVLAKVLVENYSKTKIFKLLTNNEKAKEFLRTELYAQTTNNIKK